MMACDKIYVEVKNKYFSRKKILWNGADIHQPFKKVLKNGITGSALPG